MIPRRSYGVPRIHGRSSPLHRDVIDLFDVRVDDACPVGDEHLVHGEGAADIGTGESDPHFTPSADTVGIERKGGLAVGQPAGSDDGPNLDPSQASEVVSVDLEGVVIVLEGGVEQHRGWNVPSINRERVVRIQATGVGRRVDDPIAWASDGIGSGGDGAQREDESPSIVVEG